MLYNILINLKIKLGVNTDKTLGLYAKNIYLIQLNFSRLFRNLINLGLMKNIAYRLGKLFCTLTDSLL